MKEFHIGEHKITRSSPPVIIAEIGINHNGDLDVAKKMVDAAARAGAKVIKHQTHVVDDEMSASALKVVPGNSDQSIYEIMKACALNEADEKVLKLYVESKGIEFLSTAFSRAAADRLEGMGVKAYKIGSGECNNYPLIEHVAKFGKPIILSTGMNTISSITKAVRIFEDACIPYALLHTTNLYPTPVDLVRLGAMTEMAKAFPEIPFGLSDHTTSNLACISAVALGATILERHFTDSMARQGPDIICSMDEEACVKLIQDSRSVHQMLGGVKEASAEEQVTMDFAFATVVTIRAIQAGELLTKDNIWVKRPGKGGIPAEDYKVVLGRKVRRDIASDKHLSYLDLY